jgi:hypothetical protein
VLIFADSGWKYVGSRTVQTPMSPTDEEELDDVLWW